jgi:phosphatidylserine/phosphatidylglycerophosphate/cardiolipin synthase-like enzyme
MVIDGKVTLTGSMNWTGGAALNSENLKLVASPTIAAAYAGHLHQRLALSSPYRGDKVAPQAAISADSNHTTASQRYTDYGKASRAFGSKLYW